MEHMLSMGLGLLVTLVPFLFAVFYQNILKGILTVFASLACIHLFVALGTQALGVFTYTVVFSIHVGISLICIGVIFKHRAVFTERLRALRTFFVTRYVWDKPTKHSLVFVTAVFILLIGFIYFLRFNYTGTVDTVFGVQKVQYSSYTYPMYSDEWIGSALVSYSIREKALPLVNPINANDPFINFLMATHALFAEVILVLSLDPLTQYVHLADIQMILITIVLYLIQRRLGVGYVVSAVCSFLVVLITQSGNLPGVWYALPFSVSLVFLLYGILGYLIKSRYVLFIHTAVSLVLYPPIIVFAFPVILGISAGKKMIFGRGVFTFLRVALLSLVGIGIVFMFSLADFHMVQLWQRAVNFAVRNSLDYGSVTYPIWNILPVFTLPFLLVGLYVTYKDKILALWYPVVTGIVFWIIYLYTQKVFIIEHSRVVMITSIFLLIVVGLGVQKSIDYIQTKKNIVVSLRNSTIVKILVYIALVSVTILSISFQQWFRLSMRIQTPMGDYLLVPSPSVTRYITDSDIKIFSSYKNARFVSHPWKGLVIGSATQNIPLESKSSTLTNKLLRYEFFMKASCDGKKRLIDKYNIDLVYSTKIECPKYLELVERSSEGLVLYRPIRK